ncbi:metallophosphoesterase family protein [Kurthia sibirica]|uniref:Metallophosphatase family protein n=1 Tax=Kurthia sibirica TaxID=202750 RepID=A0A2U3AR96_9BACL|nr:metallophosphoesterase family protein [Kurthia sibirica]PWI27026.1 metallophosphatase family protein [Kurthia sibirica]GEK35322.1 hypothetical protein KSI01_28550 [Kurthia sibirica]
MRYALIGDLHSNIDDTKAVLNHIKSMQQPLEIIALGDLFECTISKKKAQKATAIPLHDAADIKRSFLELLTFPSIIGNQEQRIMAATDTKIFSTMPETLSIDGARLIHGHQFDWSDDWVADPKKFSEHLVFFGHSHQSMLLRKGKQKKFKFNDSMHLKKKRYSINVGSVVHNREWCLYDSDTRTITFMKAHE